MSIANFSKQDILGIYRNSNNDGKKVLEEKLGKQYFSFDPVKDINSLEDACLYNGSDINDAIPWKDPKNADQRSVNAYAAFIEIYRAFNHGKVPVWGSDTDLKYSAWVNMPAPSGSGLSFRGTGCGHSHTYVPARLTLFNQSHVRIIFDRFPQLMEDLMVYK